MKNNIFKVCALGLITVALVTGCNEKTLNTERKEKQETNEYVLVDKDIANVKSRVNDKNEIILDAKAEDGQLVWSVNMGQPYNTDLKYFYSEIGSNGVYFSNGGAIQLRDSKTGALLWTSSEQVGFIYERIIEANGKVFGLQRVESNNDGNTDISYAIDVLDNNGEVLEYISLEKISNINPKSMSVNGNNIEIKTSDNKKVTIDTTTYNVNVK